MNGINNEYPKQSWIERSSNDSTRLTKAVYLPKRDSNASIR
jgi:hypothetical protein